MTRTRYDLAGLTTVTAQESRENRPHIIERMTLDVPQGIMLDGWNLRLRAKTWDEGAAVERRAVSVTPGLIFEFASLAAKPPAAILAFVQRWGFLGICEHYLPLNHYLLPGSIGRPSSACVHLGRRTGGGNTVPFYDGIEELADGRLGLLRRDRLIVKVSRQFSKLEWPQQDYGSWPIEPLGIWRHYARQAGAVLDLASGDGGSDADWCAALEWECDVPDDEAADDPRSLSSMMTEHLEALQPRPMAHQRDTWSSLLGRTARFPHPLEIDPEHGGPPAPLSEVDSYREQLTAAHKASRQRAGLVLAVRIAQAWLMAGKVRPHLALDSVGQSASSKRAHPQIRLAGETLFGALAVQMALAIAHTDDMFRCSMCQRAYVPKQRPRPDERRLCGAPACRRAANRVRSQEYRERQRRMSGGDAGASTGWRTFDPGPASDEGLMRFLFDSDSDFDSN